MRQYTFINQWAALQAVEGAFGFSNRAFEELFGCVALDFEFVGVGENVESGVIEHPGREVSD